VDEGEIANLLDGLEQGLIRVGLSSLVNQERIAAREGKVEGVTDQDLAEFHDQWSRQGLRRPPRARVDDVRARQLTVRERLAVLFDLLEAAVGGIYAIEASLRDDVKSTLAADGNAWNGQIVFADPPESELSLLRQQEWVVPDITALTRRAASVRAVILTINRMREQAELSRSD
jgi:hypothetical protein